MSRHRLAIALGSCGIALIVCGLVGSPRTTRADTCNRDCDASKRDARGCCPKAAGGGKDLAVKGKLDVDSRAHADGGFTIPGKQNLGLRTSDGSGWVHPQDQWSNFHLGTKTGGVYVDGGHHHFRNESGGAEAVIIETNPPHLHANGDIVTAGALYSSRAADGCNAGIVNLWDTTNNRGWHITNRRGCENALNELKFFFFDGKAWEEDVVIAPGGHVGIGPGTPAFPLSINKNGVKYHGKFPQLMVNQNNQGGGGIAISDDGGFFDHNDGWITYERLCCQGGLRINAQLAVHGHLGIGLNDAKHPIQLASGAHVTAGGVWTNASSRAFKTDVRDLAAPDALAALRALEPKRFRYRADPREEHLGFIAEDVPALVATGDRTGLSSMDLVAVLASVVRAQDDELESKERRLRELERRLEAQEVRLRRLEGRGD